MDIAKLRNPYDYANPVRDGNIFAGRGAELSRIDYVLDQAGLDRPVGYIAIHGARASGKTSLLNMTELRARRRGYLTVRVDLVPGDATPTEFFVKLYEELIGAVGAVAELVCPDGRPITPRMVRRIINGAPLDDEFPLEFPESLAHARDGGCMSEMALRADLEYLLAVAGRPIVLLVDEAQLIADSENVLSTLRVVGMQLRGYVVILAGTADLIERVHSVFDHLLRQFELIGIERFTELAEVRSCVSLPLAAVGLTTKDCFADLEATARDLMSLTDGNPYEIQFFCHTMFGRWQSGATEQLVLSPEALDEMRAVMEIRGNVRERPLVAAVRRMSAEQLVALNVLCASLDSATLDELSFAYLLGTGATMTREELQRHLDAFIADGVVELRNGVMRLPGDLFDHIYARLWTISKLGSSGHPHLIGRMEFRKVLTRQLEYLLCDIGGGDNWILRTCCFGMRQAVLNAGLAALDTLPVDRAVNYTVRYLHEAVVQCDFPAALDLTAVRCTFRDTTAVRWVFSSDSDDIDITENPLFIAASDRIAALGGELRAERTRLPLKPKDRLAEWLVSVAPTDSKDLADRYYSRSFSAYDQGDLDGAAESLITAHQIAPSWNSANNLAYVLLMASRAADAQYWAEKAIPLTENRNERALSAYNGAVGTVSSG